MTARIGQEAIVVARGATGASMTARIGQVTLIVAAPYANFVAPASTGDNFAIMAG